MPSLKQPTVAKKAPAKKATPKKVAKKETEAEMKLFTCKACNKKFPDMGLYFYETASEKCMWCRKFPSRNKPKG